LFLKNDFNLVSWGLNTVLFKNIEREKKRERGGGEGKRDFYFGKSDVKRLFAVFRDRRKKTLKLKP
jgi:hypothetical protein